ncbi:MAG: sodium-dependent transporter [Coriobacteriia bacterium]|nr:sodium-dependent transporter [Coriobacteriia bacterium]
MALGNGSSREKFATRLGFIMVSAGCAVGLGNVWRFPYICGQYGGGAFVLMYLVFLVIIGWPILCMEFTVGRGSQRGVARSFDELEQPGTKWHHYKWIALAGNYLLMMFYTTVAGWMLAYAVKSATGELSGLTPDQVGAVFGNLLASPVELFVFMTLIVAAGIGVCVLGIQKGVERITKVMMTAMLGVMVIMIVRAVTLPGGAEGLAFYLVPDFGKLFGGGLIATWDAVFAAMAHAFFTLSIGIGSMSVFGSYLSKDRTIAGEAMRVAGLDTLVAIMAGLIIFPTCFAFGVQPDSGPGLVFITLPNVFEQMPLGQLWCFLFFLFMSCAAVSTVVAVFENIMTFSIDQWGMSRKKACVINGALLFVLSIPCLLGFNVLSGVTFPGIGDIQAVEDFIVSNNLLPLGGLLFLLFCTRKSGWGFEGFLKEADTGQGMKFPRFLRGYLTYGLPVIILVVFVGGWLPVIQKWIALATGAG